MKFKIKDKLILGAFSGVLATTILNVVDYLSVILHASKWHIFQIAASLYFNQNEVTTIPALIIGGFTHTTLISLAGIIICYILYFTGRTLYIIKGICVSLFLWIMLFGGALSLGITSIVQPIGTPTNMAHLSGHFMAGILTSFLIIKLADKKAWEKPNSTEVLADEKVTTKRPEESK